MQHNRPFGFSLVEILITIAIMGVLTTLTVPAVLNSANSNLSSKQTAMAKETAMMILSAYKQYVQANGMPTSSTTFGVFTPYMNYVAIATTGQLDDHLNANALYDCSSNVVCLKLHNGGTFFYVPGLSYAGTSTTNGIYVFLDPDNVRSGVSTDGPGKTLCMILYYDGTIRSRSNIYSGTQNSAWTFYPGTYDPSWFTGF